MGEPNSLCFLFSLLLLLDVWSLLGGPDSWSLPNKPGPHFATFPSFVSTRRNHSMDYNFTNTQPQQFRRLLRVPSNADFAEWSRASRSLGSPILSPGNSFCSQSTIKSLFTFSVCVPNTQYPPFSGTKENRRWHEVSTFSLMNWTAQPEIQVLNFQQQTKSSCSSPAHWNQVTFPSASSPGRVYLLILFLSARLGVSSTCKQRKQIVHTTLWMKNKSLRLIPRIWVWVFLNGFFSSPVPKIWEVRHFGHLNRKFSLRNKIS